MTRAEKLAAEAAEARKAEQDRRTAERRRREAQAHAIAETLRSAAARVSIDDVTITVVVSRLTDGSYTVHSDPAGCVARWHVSAADPLHSDPLVIASGNQRLAVDDERYQAILDFLSEPA